MLTRALLVLSCVTVAACGGTAHHAVARHYVLRLGVAGSAPASATSLERSTAIARDRLRLLGIRGGRVRLAGRVLVVSLPHASSARLVAALTERGQLAIYDLEPALAPPSIGSARHVVAFTSVRELLRGRKLPRKEIVVTCGKDGDRFCPGVNEAPPTRTYYYLFKHGGSFPQLTRADLKTGSIRAQLDPANGTPVVRLYFTPAGGEKFARITANEYARGKARKVAQHFAIVVDGDIRSAPQIDYTDPSLAQGISGGGQIAGLRSLRDARAIAAELESGALPVKLVRVR